MSILFQPQQIQNRPTLEETLIALISRATNGQSSKISFSYIKHILTFTNSNEKITELIPAIFKVIDTKSDDSTIVLKCLKIVYICILSSNGFTSIMRNFLPEIQSLALLSFNNAKDPNMKQIHNISKNIYLYLINSSDLPSPESLNVELPPSVKFLKSNNRANKKSKESVENINDDMITFDSPMENSEPSNNLSEITNTTPETENLLSFDDQFEESNISRENFNDISLLGDDLITLQNNNNDVSLKEEDDLIQQPSNSSNHDYLLDLLETNEDNKEDSKYRNLNSKNSGLLSEFSDFSHSLKNSLSKGIFDAVEKKENNNSSNDILVNLNDAGKLSKSNDFSSNNANIIENNSLFEQFLESKVKENIIEKQSSSFKKQDRYNLNGTIQTHNNIQSDSFNVNSQYLQDNQIEKDVKTDNPTLSKKEDIDLLNDFSAPQNSTNQLTLNTNNEEKSSLNETLFEPINSNLKENSEKNDIFEFIEDFSQKNDQPKISSIKELVSSDQQNTSKENVQGMNPNELDNIDLFSNFTRNPENQVLSSTGKDFSNSYNLSFQSKTLSNQNDSIDLFSDNSGKLENQNIFIQIQNSPSTSTNIVEISNLHNSNTYETDSMKSDLSEKHVREKSLLSFQNETNSNNLFQNNFNTNSNSHELEFNNKDVFDPLSDLNQQENKINQSLNNTSNNILPQNKMNSNYPPSSSEHDDLLDIFSEFMEKKDNKNVSLINQSQSNSSSRSSEKISSNLIHKSLSIYDNQEAPTKQIISDSERNSKNNQTDSFDLFSEFSDKIENKSKSSTDVETFKSSSHSFAQTSNIDDTNDLLSDFLNQPADIPKNNINSNSPQDNSNSLDIFSDFAYSSSQKSNGNINHSAKIENQKVNEDQEDVDLYNPFARSPITPPASVELCDPFESLSGNTFNQQTSPNSFQPIIDYSSPASLISESFGENVEIQNSFLDSVNINQGIKVQARTQSKPTKKDDLLDLF